MQRPDEHAGLDLLAHPLIQERGFARWHYAALRAGAPVSGSNGGNSMPSACRRRAEATAHVFRRALPFLLRSLEQRRSQSALGLEEYSLRKYF
jgi:hypothetical protein